jgi:sulfate permease, SulP family
LFGGIPATGAIARTATNVKNGGRTPVAGMMHAVTVLLITLFFGKWAALIPMATLAGILLVVAYGMSEWRGFVAELSSPKSDVAVLLVTFFLTVLVDLTVAIEVGMILAAFLFLKRMADVTNVTLITDEIRDREDEYDAGATGNFAVPRGVEVFEINGPFFFGAAATFQDTLGLISSKPRILILRMRKVPVMDATGLHALSEVVHRSRKDGVLVLLSGVQPQPLATIQRSVLLDEIGEENICPSFEEALARASEELELKRLMSS